MKPRSVRFAPPIPTAATHSLERSITRLIRRRPDVTETVEAIRAGDNEILLRLIHQARAGDPDSAAIAIWSILPRLCAVVRSRMAPADWRTTTDEYLSIAYLAIRDVSDVEPTQFLADKLIARVRRRHERSVEADRRFRKHLPFDPLSEGDETPSRDVPVDEHALMRLRLTTLRDARRKHPAVRADLQVIVQSMQQTAPQPGPKRMAVLRSRRRLLDHLNEAA